MGPPTKCPANTSPASLAAWPFSVAATNCPGTPGPAAPTHGDFRESRLLDLCSVLDEKLLQDGTVAAVFVLAVAANRKVGRARKHGEELQVVPRPWRGHFGFVLLRKRRPLCR